MAGGGRQEFSYHRSLTPMMWMFVLIAGVELLVVHFLVSFWNVTVALILSALSLASIGWVVAMIRAMKRQPVRLDAARLDIGVAGLKRVETPIANIAGLRAAWTAEDLKQPGVLNLALLAYPNVVIDLAAPIPGRRPIRAIAHRLDDPAGFEAALSERLSAARPS